MVFILFVDKEYLMYGWIMISKGGAPDNLVAIVRCRANKGIFNVTQKNRHYKHRDQDRTGIYTSQGNRCGERLAESQEV